MPRWSDYTTGDRIAILRGPSIRQSDLAEMTGLSLPTIQQAEQDKRLTLSTLLKVSDALGADTAVILGQQAPRRAMQHEDRAMMRALSRAVHDSWVGILPDTVEPSTFDELRAVTDRCWDLYWKGHYTEAGAVVGPFLVSAAARLHEQPDGEQAEAWSILADAYRIAAYVSNLMGARDLAYAAIGHAQEAAQRGADDLRQALVMSGRAWVYLRDARMPDAMRLAEKAVLDVEPRFSRATPEQLTVYGSHANFAAVVAARMDDEDRASDFLSQSNAVGARMGREVRAHGTLFGPVSATTQAVGINVALGETGKALELMSSIRDDDLDSLSGAARNRYALDKAMAYADASMWDASLETLEETLTESPDWGRHQALPGVILQKVGKGSTSKLRRVSELVGVAPGVTGYSPATEKTAL